MTDLPAKQEPIEVEVIEKPKHPGGRPTKYRETFPEKVYLFIERQLTLGMLPTMAGLCCHLSLDKQTILNYGKAYPQFFDAIKKLKHMQENMILQLLSRGNGSTAGLIFMLKNNHGYKDVQALEVTEVEKKQIMIVNGREIEF